uniref:Diadenosine tetraphosphatase n=1 Tax=uncultured Thiotrichaceae bacterium TaxID=298394 RepID=A0A6S6TCW5_9GAMM|nr:MAG: Diadenosine tetraphosphatase [uncultured Thiotrichaceae bacterium]
MDLGILQGEVLVFGGNYSNLQATQAIQAEAARRGIPAERVICTGDVVAYCGQPEETTQLMREWGAPVVMGNCEESLGFDAEDCGCGFEEGTACAVLSDSWFNFSRNRVSDVSKAWMRALPRTVSFELGGKCFQVVHGGTTVINRFVFASMPDQVFQAEFADVEADVVIGGHAGIPFARRYEQRYWLNAGVIGMPANNASTGTWYMLLSEVDGAVQVSWHALEYDAVAAQAVMRECGQDNAYAKALLTGLWPGLDALPETEQQQTGQPLSLSNIRLS